MTKYLITGAARGIGFELVKTLLAQDSTELVIAAVRSHSDKLSAYEQNPKLKIVLLDVSDEESVKRAAEELKSHKINVLINNAAIAYYASLKETTVEELLSVYRTNTIGPILVTRNFAPLLEGTESQPAIIANISSTMGSITNTDTVLGAAYRISKTALNMVNKLSSVEYKDIISVAINPGWVQTDMGGPNAHITPQESIEGILKVISNLQIEDTGKFLDYKGPEVPF